MVDRAPQTEEGCKNFENVILSGVCFWDEENCSLEKGYTVIKFFNCVLHPFYEFKKPAINRIACFLAVHKEVGALKNVGKNKSGKMERKKRRRTIWY